MHVRTNTVRPFKCMLKKVAWRRKEALYSSCKVFMVICVIVYLFYSYIYLCENRFQGRKWREGLNI
jgi:hypothetical protein